MEQEHYFKQYTARGVLDFEAFTDKIKELLDLANIHYLPVTFMMDEPTDNDPKHIQLPVITFDTFERVRSESFPSLEPVRFHKFVDPESRDTVEVYRMWFDTETEFQIYHQTNREARILMNEFEDFLFSYKSYFKELGLSDIIFLAETKPEVVTRWQQPVVKRTLRYLVRTERITTIRSHILEKVTPVKVEDGQVKTDINYDSNPFMYHYRSLNR